MTMTDPIADMLTRIRNANVVNMLTLLTFVDTLGFTRLINVKVAENTQLVYTICISTLGGTEETPGSRERQARE